MSVKTAAEENSKRWPLLVSTAISLLSILVCGLILMINQAGRNGSFAMQELSATLQRRWTDFVFGGGLCNLIIIFLIVFVSLLLAVNNTKNRLIVLLQLFISAGIFTFTLFFSFSVAGFVPVDELTVNENTFHLVRISAAGDSYFRLYKCDLSGITCETLYFSRPDGEWYKPAVIYDLEDTVFVRLDGEIVYTHLIE